MLDRLKTKSGLFQYGIGDSNLCVICGGARETSAHLFFDFSYNKECLKDTLEWLGVRMSRTFVLHVLHWIRTYCRNSFKRKVYYAAV